MWKFRSLLSISVLIGSSLFSFAAPASATPALITCTDLFSQKTVVLKSLDAKCRDFTATAHWTKEQSDSVSRTGEGYARLTICSSKNSDFTYKLIRDSCPKFQLSTNYWRAVAIPATPVIVAAYARGHESALLEVQTSATGSAPIAYYLVTDNKTGASKRVVPGNLGNINMSGLSSATSYTFTVAAVTIDGISQNSPITPVITTNLAPVVATTAPLAAPAFTISSASETKTVNNAIAGYSINSTGGTIASYAISPSAPAGLSFDGATGLLSGTPTVVAGATAYTITATNGSGSTTKTFTLRVLAVTYTVGQIGPGGGTIFYVATTPFTCGPTLNLMCTYLEAAPTSNAVANYWTDSRYLWAGAFLVTNGAYEIGTGFKNTLAMINPPTGDNTPNRAGFVAQAYRGPNNLDDWFLPSKDELNALYEARASVADLVFTGENRYWSSSTGNSANRAERQYFAGGNQYTDFKSGSFNVRPIRAF
jgi:hypothetical protein